jgi:tetratricopeptide (TPR) repeat protein
MDNDDDKKVHVGTGVKVTWWGKILRRSVLIPIITLLVLVIGTTVFLKVRSDTLAANREKQAVLQSAFKIAEAAKTDNGYQLAYDALVAAEGSARTKAEKISYYTYLYLAAQNTSRLSESLKYREQIHKLDADKIGPDALLMAQDYEKLGDKEKALEQYKIALAYLRPKADKGEVYLDYIGQIELKITELEKQ